MARQALLRPIQIDSSNDELITSGGTIRVPHGVYANIYAFGLTPTVPPFRAVSALPFSGTFGRLLGFDGSERPTNIGGDSYYIANHAPAGCWISEHQHTTPERWAADPAEMFSGAYTMDGRLHGITMGSISDRQKLTMRWPLEPAANVYPDAAAKAISLPGGIWRPEQAASFWSVVNGARTAYSSGAAPGAPSPKGVYYVPDLDAIDETSGRPFWYGELAQYWFGAALFETWGSGGLNFCGGDKNVFCSVAGEPKLPTPYNNRDMYYDCEVTLMTATAPDWSAPEWSEP